MNKKILALLVIFLIVFSFAISYAEIDTYDCDANCQHQEVVEVNSANDMIPTYIEHHTCSRGGTSCAECHADTLTKSCGCIYTSYYCCCGKKMSGELIYCSQHSY